MRVEIDFVIMLGRFENFIRFHANESMFLLRLFLQPHQEEIEAPPDVLTDKVILLPEILRRSRADNSCRKYELGFSR